VTGWLRAYGVDVLGLIAFTAIGHTVHRLLPDLLGLYAGTVIFAVCFAVVRGRDADDTNGA